MPYGPTSPAMRARRSALIVGPHDPQIPLALVGVLRSDTWRHLLDQHYWCTIAPGPFWSGDDRQQDGGAMVPLRQAQIRMPYRIARYPVTNADYARFLAANGLDGYDPARPWWTEHGRAYLRPGSARFPGEPAQLRHPRFWAVARYNGPLQPVVGVSWYEATAYCRWLTAAGHAAGWLPQGEVIRLPTWHEWERAARHTDPHRYPWGAEPPTPEWANYRDTGLGVLAPIGCFPGGRAVCGTHDMLGNVIEWSASPWDRWEDWQADLPAQDQVVTSYSSFASRTEVLCCGAHGWNHPIGRHNNWGFRVVQSRALTE